MSRLTFDTIGLCAYGYRFNEFYSEDPHPFQKQLKEAIVESGRRANRPDLMNSLYYYKDEQHRQENITKIRELCRQIIQERIDNPKPDAKDLLNIMIHGVDKVSGEMMGIENVMYQIPTLLGGGYETTSSTLSFIWYLLCKNPETLRKAQEEVDTVVGKDVLTYDMIRELKYLDACMKEALRIQHPVSLLTRFSTRETVLGGKYFIKKGQMVSGIWRHFHRDPDVWGPDADEFRPERMLEVNFSKMPPNAWKPVSTIPDSKVIWSSANCSHTPWLQFGDGLRACIGRGFAEQEILICMAMVLQKFNVELVKPDYELQLTGQMGVKPVDLKIRVRRRQGRTLTLGIPGGGSASRQNLAVTEQQPQAKVNGTATQHESLKPVSVLFSGNQGTCESLVESFVVSARRFNLEATDIREMDAAVEHLPTDKPILIITPSYEGRPADNAKKFVSWVEAWASKGKRLPDGVKFAVFGVGNSDWVHTFHRIPKLVDEKLAQIGAERIMDAGFTNVKRDLVGSWEAWSEQFCVAIAGEGAKQKQTDRVGVDVVIENAHLKTPQQALDGEQVILGTVVANHQLADASVGSAKRHLEVRLPRGSEYRSGDYLVVQGQNPDDTVSRVMKRFGLSSDDVMSVPLSKKSFLPTQPTAVEDFLRKNVELAVPITKRQLATLATWASENSIERTRLNMMQEESIYQGLLDKRYSILDVLEEVPGLSLPFGVYIDLLLPLMPRTYSIASSPLDPQSRRLEGADSSSGPIAALTVDIFESPALSGHGTFRGVASSYLARRSIGDRIPCLVRQTKEAFQLPVNTKTPIIMLAAGSGIAPMRAFIQERAAAAKQAKAGAAGLGPALFFYGCRHPEKDYLYRAELEMWEKEGLVELIPCFSKPSGGKKGGRHVPDALWEDRERVWKLFGEGAKIYVCGSAARLGMSSAETWRRIWREKTGKSEVEALEWLEQVKSSHQYVSDVY